jgi:hypothetical protein
LKEKIIKISEVKTASSALNNIDKANIAELKAYLKPPIGVQLVLEAVFILLQGEVLIRSRLGRAR